jgi:hypothetical protein
MEDSSYPTLHQSLERYALSHLLPEEMGSGKQLVTYIFFEMLTCDVIYCNGIKHGNYIAVIYNNAYATA